MINQIVIIFVLLLIKTTANNYAYNSRTPE